MFTRFLHDDRGVMAAEYALLLALACGCMAVLSFAIGNKVSKAIYHASELISNNVTRIISDEVDTIKRGG